MKYFIQAYRHGHSSPWTTDRHVEDLAAAIDHAKKLVAQFDRKVRVVDDTERVHWRSTANKKQAVHS